MLIQIFTDPPQEEIIATCSTGKSELPHSFVFLMPNCIIALSCMNFVKMSFEYRGREGIENSATPTQVSELCRCFPLAMQPPALRWTPYKQKLQCKCITNCDFSVLRRAVIAVHMTT